jgi:lipopolysaccharide export system protein LptA
MPSNTGLDGGPAKKTNSRVQIHWNKDMLFDGKTADFHGGVVAYQDDGSLQCQSMQVTLDRVVSLKEGQKGGQAAKVDRLDCDRQVFIVDTTRDARGALVRYQRVEGTGMTMDNQGGPTVVIGDGSARTLQPGNAETTPGAVKPAAATTAPQQPQELWLTRVDFRGRMFTINHTDKSRVTIFYDKVRVYHQPADSPDVQISQDRLPKGALHMQCEKLTVTSKPLADGKNGQYMEAEKKVTFQTVEFYGRAPSLKYNQPEDIVIFKGTREDPVEINQYQGPGRPVKTIRGQEILYNRKTGTWGGTFDTIGSPR